MSHFSCLVQQGGAADLQRAELEKRLHTLHESHHPGETTTFAWRTAAIGFMYTEGRQSTSSVIQCQLQHPTTRDGREAYMRGVCDIWTDVTGCTDHEIVVSLSDTASA